MLMKPLPTAILAALVVALAVLGYFYCQRTNEDITIHVPSRRSLARRALPRLRKHRIVASSVVFAIAVRSRPAESVSGFRAYPSAGAGLWSASGSAIQPSRSHR